MSRELLMMQNSFEWETKEGKTIETDKALNCKARNLKIEGQTYQNLSGVSTAESSENKFYKYEKITGIKPSTTYTWIFDIKSENTLTAGNITEIARIDLTGENGNQSIPCGFTGTVTNVFQRVKLKFNTPSANIKFIEFNLRNQFNVIDSSLTSNTITIKNNMLLEGDYTNTDLPILINGIESVAEREREGNLYPIILANRGKNLLNVATFTTISNSSIQASIDGNIITIKGLKTADEEAYTYPNACNVKTYLEEGKTYTFSFKSDAEFGGTPGTDTVELFFMLNGTTSNYFKVQGQNTVTIPRGFTGNYYVRFDVNSGDKTHKFWDIQVEEGSVVTDYEPYLNTTTEIPLPQPLRSLPNNVTDTVEGNKIIKRIGKYTITETEQYELRYENDGMFTIQCSGLSMETAFSDYWNSNVKMICDKAVCENCVDTAFITNTLTICGRSSNLKGFIIAIPKNLLTEYTIDKAKEYIKSLGGMTVYYELATPIEHTINVPRIPIAKGSNIITTTNNIKPNLSIKYKKLKNKVR